ncbi:MAG: flagellar hook-basal body complex protein FliE [Rhizobiaceae bacterium]|nr:flagellar hook-basal body complex protein FliE [Rhizobiaceae bacterium]
MIINPLSAINGLGSLLDGIGSAAGAAGAAAGGAASPGSFADLVSDGATNTIERLRTSEKISFDALQGKADTREVVDAVMSAEQSLQAAIAIRDKIVSSYLEVSRMAI